MWHRWRLIYSNCLQLQITSLYCIYYHHHRLLAHPTRPLERKPAEAPWRPRPSQVRHESHAVQSKPPIVSIHRLLLLLLHIHQLQILSYDLSPGQLWASVKVPARDQTKCSLGHFFKYSTICLSNTSLCSHIMHTYRDARFFKCSENKSWFLSHVTAKPEVTWHWVIYIIL